MKDNKLLDKRAVPIVGKLHRYIDLSRKSSSYRRKKKYLRKAINEEINLVRLINIITEERNRYIEICMSKTEESEMASA